MREWLEAAKANSVFRLTGIAFVIAFILDQASKTWIVQGLDLANAAPQYGYVERGGELQTVRLPDIEVSPVIDILFVENRGFSFGLMGESGMAGRILLTLLAIGVAGFILHWAGTLTRRVAAIGAGLIVGGALGNALDRVIYGYVVDFIDARDVFFPWQFNIADVAINLGVACLAYDAFFVVPKQEAKSTPLPDEPDRAVLSEDENPPVPGDNPAIDKR